MKSFIEALHKAYCDSTGVDLFLNVVFERWWFGAHKLGVTPDDVYLCVKHRQKLNAQREVHFRQGLEIKHLVRDEESIASMLNEAAILRAQMRKKVFPQGKQDVLRATGRDTEPQTKPRHISEIFKDIQKQ